MRAPATTANERRETERAHWRLRRRDPVAREKNVAREKVRHAVFAGRLARGPCAVCNCAVTEAHHPDYQKPFLLVWLCRQHHSGLHRHIRDGRTQEAAAIEGLATEVYPVNRPRRGGGNTPPENALKTHCPLGHQLSGTNLYRDPSGYRSCRICRNEAGRQSKRRARAKAKGAL